MGMVSHLLAANALLTAFAAVGLIMWMSNALSRHLTFGRVHGSAIAILIGLALAFQNGDALHVRMRMQRRLVTRRRGLDAGAKRRRA